MNCNHCKSQIPDNSEVCPVCRNIIKDAKPKRSKNSVIMMLVLVIAIFTIAVLVSAVIILSNRLENAADDKTKLNGGSQTTNVPRITATPDITSSEKPEPTPKVIVITPEPQPEPTPKVIVITPEPQRSNPAPEPVVDNSVKYSLYVVKCDEWISLRSTPSTKASRLTTIPLGASVGFISTASNGFYKVEYNGKIGYALSQYLSSTYSVPATPKPTYHMTVVNCDEWISLRTSPSTGASRITTIPLGASVEYISESSNGFYKVRYNGRTGYALSQYLR